MHGVTFTSHGDVNKMARRRNANRQSKRRTAVPTRAKIVWLSLMAAMTSVGGLLLLLDPTPAPRLDGLTLTQLATTGISPTLEPIFNTRAELGKTRWKAIVIHHLARPEGSPESIARLYRQAGAGSIGHHFVIGNGRGMEDGQIHVSHRWLDQVGGEHAAGPDAERYNEQAISICLVGDGNRREFTPLQRERLRSLVHALQRRLGIPDSAVLLHRQVAPGTTDPGRFFPEAELRQFLAASR